MHDFVFHDYLHHQILVKEEMLLFLLMNQLIVQYHQVYDILIVYVYYLFQVIDHQLKINLVQYFHVQFLQLIYDNHDQINDILLHLMVHFDVFLNELFLID